LNLSRRELLWLAAGAVRTEALRAGEKSSPLFLEIPPLKSGIQFVHESAMSPQRHLPETMGPGAAFLDYDNDGWMDIYIVNSGPSDFFAPVKPLRNALYRNNRDGTFTDVTEKAGVGGGSFGMGVTAGDFDNNGWPDLFVTAYGKCILYRNNRDGTFSDVTEKAGVSTPGWTTSATWCDYDNDGRLDLFVCGFVAYTPDQHATCGKNALGRYYYCTPRLHKPGVSYLYHNNGDGTFTEVGHKSVIGKMAGKALAVVTTDINNDGLMDLFVANDTVQNYLYINRGPGPNGEWKWEEAALNASVAFSEAGKARSGMGADAADLSNRGWQDLFVTNIDHEIFAVYHNNGDETFQDVAERHDVGQATRLLSGWGLKYFDYDNDGAVDLILANGHPDDMIAEYSLKVSWKEPLLLFHQEGDGKLRDVSDRGGPAFEGRYNARGLAVGDFDNDGAVDVLVCVNGDRPLLLKNNAAAGNNWLGLRLEGVTANRDAIGARIVWTAGGKTFHRLKNSGGSYLSSHDPREVLGIGTAEKIDSVEIHWPGPSKQVDILTKLPINTYLKVVEGKGIATA
jgi:hypothetical protein